MIFRRVQLQVQLLLSTLAAIWLCGFFWQAKVVHDLEGTEDDNNPVKKILSFSKNLTKRKIKAYNWKKVKDPFFDKAKIMAMLMEMQTDPHSILNSTWARVPTWSRVVEVWGPEPVVYGLEQHCTTFREQVQEAQFRRIGVAGLWSTGTDVLYELLQHNCAIPERVTWLGRGSGHGMEWEVPWGKHSPFHFRVNHFNKTKFVQYKSRDTNLEHFLPVVTIREPLSWMNSMCREEYNLKWKHTKHNCPSLIDQKTSEVHNVTARFYGDEIKYDSVAHLWNEWNKEYFYTNQQKPAIMVRFEDLFFYPKEVTQKVCECAGGKLMKPHHLKGDLQSSGGNFYYIVRSVIGGKERGSYDPQRELLEAWIEYSKPKEFLRFPRADRYFAEGVFDQTMLSTFGYT